jgi:2-C-methyl-D-erythritol 2,4-cyclodiphosphate synthase
VSSLSLLSLTVNALHSAGYRVVNVDSTVIAQEPPLLPHIRAMQTNLVKRLGTRNVNVKGKSPEGLGALGQQAGIAAQAVAMIKKR